MTALDVGKTILKLLKDSKCTIRAYEGEIQGCIIEGPDDGCVIYNKDQPRTSSYISEEDDGLWQ
jgi:hypothetical protein